MEYFVMSCLISCLAIMVITMAGFEMFNAMTAYKLVASAAMAAILNVVMKTPIIVRQLIRC